jgi:hypothetical protein
VGEVDDAVAGPEEPESVDSWGEGVGAGVGAGCGVELEDAVAVIMGEGDAILAVVVLGLLVV